MFRSYVGLIDSIGKIRDFSPVNVASSTPSSPLCPYSSPLNFEKSNLNLDKSKFSPISALTGPILTLKSLICEFSLTHPISPIV